MFFFKNLKIKKVKNFKTTLYVVRGPGGRLACGLPDKRMEARTKSSIAAGAGSRARHQAINVFREFVLFSFES